MLSSILYLILFCWLLAFLMNRGSATFYSNDLIRYYIVWILILVIVTFRPIGMPDYIDYVESFNHGSDRMELGFFVILKLTRFLSNSYLLLMFIYALLSVTIIMYAIKKNSDYIWGAVLVWMSYMLIMQSMIQIRQAVASAFFLLSIPCIYKKQLNKYLILNGIGFIFHYSALAVVPLYFLSKNREYKCLYLLLIPISYILYWGNMRIAYLIEFIDVDFIQALWLSKSTTLDVTADVNLYNSRQIIQIALCYMMWFRIDNIKKFVPMAPLYLKIYTIAIVAFIIFFDVPDIASRINVIYIIVEILLLPTIYFAFNNRILCKYFFLLISCLFFFTYYLRFILVNIKI